MQERALEGRVGSLELRSDHTEGRVNTLERELKEFRAEVRDGFTRVDQEFVKVRQEAAEFRAEVRGEFTTVHARIDGVEQRMQEGFEQARQLTLVLHEDLVSRIKTLGEGLPARKADPGTEA
jgi:predicted  nucleic acid-binding Zn-ribbon protein